MKHILVQMMSQLTQLNEEEEKSIAESFPIKTYNKGYYILKEGQVATAAYFLIEGCVREYELQDGEENTTAFFTENDAIVNFLSQSQSIPSKINFVCIEESTVAVLNSEKEQDLYNKHPRFESFCRTGMEQMLGQKHSQLSTYISLKPEQRYLKLLEERPGLVQRVPQYQIASFLGIKPETLSRIRKKLAKSS